MWGSEGDVCAMAPSSRASSFLRRAPASPPNSATPPPPPERHDAALQTHAQASATALSVIQESMSLKYEPASEPLHHPLHEHP